MYEAVNTKAMHVNTTKQYKFDVNTLRLDYTCTSNLTLNITVTQKLKSWQYQQKLNS